MKNLTLGLFTLIILNSFQQQLDHRKLISLNGEWEIAKTDTFTLMPQEFKSKVPVPGLVDLASPVLDTNHLYKKGIYWYKTNFTIGQDYPELVQLKIGKVIYHARVYLNNKFVGEHLYCFTSALFDIREFLNPAGENNELLIGVGTANNMPDTVIWGSDFEKLYYTPGIYDDVNLILSGSPFISNIQTVPLVKEKKIKIVAYIDEAGKDKKISLSYLIKELKSGKIVAKGKTKSEDFTVSIPDCKLWTPESPFLYELTLSTGADEKKVRFGMRSFSFDASTGRAMLNMKPYFMRGTNVCIFRFFEDYDRGLLPWNNAWVIKLHQQFKSMYWNSIRYCIGLPPERWYDIADSLGILLQNEYPVWTGGRQGFNRIYPGVTSERLANEYRAWLPEHWNHPSVVIWDAQNESVTEITGEAINKVRGMDLSNRPWENGWSAPQSENDPMESHPYLFGRYSRGGPPPSSRGPMADFFVHIQVPGNSAEDHSPREDKSRYPNAIINNEYSWLELNRDGTTTPITDKVFELCFGPNLTKDERIYFQTRYLGMLTEYWRANRFCAGVLDFCGLGYSRPTEPRGITSDHFIDIKNLIYEPLYVKYVKPAFAPVGLMIDFWDRNLTSGGSGLTIGIEVYAINDLEKSWSGPLTLTLRSDSGVISTQIKEIEIPAFGRVITTFPLDIRQGAGKYQLEAEINYQGEPVKSIREFTVELAPAPVRRR